MKTRRGTPRRAVLPYAGRLDPGGMEIVDGGTREALIEQQPHRAWGRGKTLSSTKAAAKASACRISSSSSLRVFALQFGTVRIDGERFKDSANGKTEVPDAGLAVHPSRISRDSIEFLHLFSASSRQAPAGV